MSQDLDELEEKLFLAQVNARRELDELKRQVQKRWFFSRTFKNTIAFTIEELFQHSLGVTASLVETRRQAKAKKEKGDV